MTALQAADIQVQVGNAAEGILHAELHSADAARWDAPLQQMTRSADGFIFSDVPPGDYAVQVFLDQNGNGRLDLSPRGLPREPVGFSNMPRLLMGKPAPSGCAFEHGEVDSLLLIELRSSRTTRSGTGEPAD